MLTSDRWASVIPGLPLNPLWLQFAPIPDLVNMTADTALISLMSSYDYSAESTDPWFRIDNCTTSTGFMSTTCISANPLSFVGCQEQYQLCKEDASPESDSCTPLTGYYSLFPDLSPTKGSARNGTTLTSLNPTQKSLYYFLAKLMASSQLHWQLTYIGRENMVAQDLLWDGGFAYRTSAPLPSNQWEREVMNWMNVSLTNVQRGAVAYSRPSQYDVGGGNLSVHFIEQPQDPELRSLCDKILMRSSKHSSFSVFAMSATVLVAVLSMLLDRGIRRAFAWYHRRTGHGSYKTREWRDNSVFQLQRMAAEGKGVGPWKDKDGDVPTLVDPDLLFSLAERHRYGPTAKKRNGFNYEYGPLQKYAFNHAEEVDAQGFVELRSLEGSNTYGA